MFMAQKNGRALPTSQDGNFQNSKTHVGSFMCGYIVGPLVADIGSKKETDM